MVNGSLFKILFSFNSMFASFLRISFLHDQRDRNPEVSFEVASIKPVMNGAYLSVEKGGKIITWPSKFTAVAAAAAKSHQLCLTLCNPIDSRPTGSSVPGILQARILEWVAISFSNE